MRIATASWTRCGLPAVKAGSAPRNLTPGWSRVTLDFTRAVITSSVLRIDANMQLGKLFIVRPPGIVINTDALTLTYSKLKLHSKNAAADPRLRIELAGSLLHAKVIEQRPRRRKAADR
jgi:hypothetical protein